MQIRLLPFASADGATNMSADDTLAHSAAEGTASLRFYGWSAATVSLGYFQSHLVHRADPLLSTLPCVRRPSGGATLVHHRELTYALALPSAQAWHGSEPWLMRMHHIIVAALGELGLAKQIHLVEAHPAKQSDILCFQQLTIGDVLCNGYKIVGSAQRKYRQALMQHGSILMAQSEHTPRLPGIRELTGVQLSVEQVQTAVTRQFAQATGWHAETSTWTESELNCIKTLIRTRYAGAAWTERR